MNNKFIEAAQKRRSIYQLGNSVVLPDNEIVNIIKAAIRQAPSAFNNQPIRIVILFNDAHHRLWNYTKKVVYQKMTHKEKFGKTEAKLNAFKAAHGTILFFSDEETIQNSKNIYKSYANYFDDWTEEAVGIAIYSVWTALANADIGASIQHYNPLIDDWISEQFNVPKNYILRGEMPFGSINALAGEKKFLSDDKVFKVIE